MRHPLFVLKPAAIIALLLAVLPLPALAGAFTDVPRGAWYAADVQTASELGIVAGYQRPDGSPTGTFGPADPVTVAQALKIALVGAGYDVRQFANQQIGMENHWAAAYLRVAAAEGFWVFEQHPDIDKPATRAEVAQIFADAFQVETAWGQADAFTDVTTTTPYAAAIHSLSTDGVISGDTDAAGNPLHRFRPTDKIKRAEVVKIVMRARVHYGEPGGGPVPATHSSAVSSHAAIPVSPVSAQQSATVQYTQTGFSPSSVTIAVGGTVTFVNQGGADMWVASNPHPIHTDYPGFDAGRGYPSGQSYTFTFTRSGSWRYHDHLNPNRGGTVVVNQ